MWEAALSHRRDTDTSWESLTPARKCVRTQSRVGVAWAGSPFRVCRRTLDQMQGLLCSSWCMVCVQQIRGQAGRRHAARTPRARAGCVPGCASGGRCMRAHLVGRRGELVVEWRRVCVRAYGMRRANADQPRQRKVKGQSTETRRMSFRYLKCRVRLQRCSRSSSAVIRASIKPSAQRKRWMMARRGWQR